MSYYTAKVQLIDTIDTPKGTKEKKTTETYLVEALSVTEAEAKVVEDFKGYTFKNVVHDVLLENRSAVCMITSNPKHDTYLNKHLTAMLCDTELIQTTIPYKKLLAEDGLPITKS